MQRAVGRHCANCRKIQFGDLRTCLACGTSNWAKRHTSVHDIVRATDWICPTCADSQFARNVQCRRCGTARPGAPQARDDSGPRDVVRGVVRGADWNCPKCSDSQFARNTRCRRCDTARPGAPPVRDDSGPRGEVRVTDWFCSKCGDHQFGCNLSCRRCFAPRRDSPPGPGSRPVTMHDTASTADRPTVVARARPAPKPDQRPGDWECTAPKCSGELNFGNRTHCWTCGAEREAPPAAPAEAAHPVAAEDGDGNVCVVCMDNRPEIIIDACKHMKLCVVCAPLLNKCPMCSVPYDAATGTSKVYY